MLSWTLLRRRIFYSVVLAALMTKAAAQNKADEQKKSPNLTEKQTDKLPAHGAGGGEYIPCKFSETELRALKTPGSAQTLTEADAERLKERVIAAATSELAKSTFSTSSLSTFVNDVSNEVWVGLTPSSASNRIMTLLREDRNSDAKATEADIMKLKNQMVELLPPSATSSLNKYFDHLSNRISNPPVLAYKLQEFVADDYATWVNNSTNKDAVPLKDTLERVQNWLKSTTTEGLSSIMDAARQSLEILERPDDVGCAMSILAASEVERAYGSVIAREYIAVQVVIRNLNKDEPFLLHDVEFGIDAYQNDHISNFSSGRDKVIVRALSSAQQDFNGRNLAVHTAYGVGALLSAAAPFFTQVFVNAAGVYNGAFVPSFDKYFKDQSGDQLNLLNDTGFSSSLNYQTVVPKSGTVMIVTFIPSKQFRQGWWTQSCVDQIYLGSTDKNGNVIPAGKPFANGVGHANVQRALEACAAGLQGGKKASTGIQSVPQSTTNRPPNANLFQVARPVEYKNWSGNALSIFREISETLVAGTHIIEESELEPVITQLICPTDSNGNLVYPENNSTQLACTVIGKNLYRFAKLRLRNAKDPTDPTTVEGSLTISGDSGNGTVSFPVTPLQALAQPVYQVFGVTTNGIEEKTSQVIHLNLGPVVKDISPTAIDFSTDSKPKEVKLDGYHLDSVDSLRLTSPEGIEASIWSGPLN